VRVDRAALPSLAAGSSRLDVLATARVVERVVRALGVVEEGRLPALLLPEPGADD
jgi:hypothetical protein